MSARPRILAVDDEPRGVELVARTLRKVGEVESAGSGDAAWELLERREFELVISDQRMPGMSGVELLSRLAARRSHVGRILLTGYADMGATIEAINRGQVHAYLTKPCPPDQLRVTVGSVLERVRLARDNARLVGELSSKNRELQALLSDLERTQQRVVEAERLSAIGSMVASIVHDFRGPLSVIASSGCELRAAADQAVRDAAGRIVAECERISCMGRELLDMTRVSAGSPRLVEDDLDDVVQSALAALCHDASAAGVSIESDLRAAARMPLDEARIRRVVLNLGYNAIDAMPDGGVLRIETERGDGRVTVSVRDTGRGIPEELRERLFEPFVTAGKKSGSGLGLAIVKRVVEEHGGRVEVGKPEGGGAAFHLHFPLDERS